MRKVGNVVGLGVKVEVYVNEEGNVEYRFADGRVLSQSEMEEKYPEVLED
jgi:hypothetical protein